MSGLATSTRIKTNQTVKTQISPAAIQGLSVLALPIASLSEYVQRKAEENPLLELDYSDSAVDFCDISLMEEEGASQEEPSAARHKPYFKSTASRYEVDFERLRVGDSADDSLQGFLRMQMGEMSFPDATCRHLCEALIESIDDDGYLAEDLGRFYGRQGCTYEQAEAVLRRVQSMQPKGVGARNLKECLQLQMDDDNPRNAAAFELLENHFEDFAYNRSSQLARESHVSREGIREIREYIQTLNPRPGSMYGAGDTATYIIPDIKITQGEGQFSIEITGEIGGKVTLDQEYLAMSVNEPEAREWLADRVADAHQVLKNIDDRKRTLHRLANYLLVEQYEFFCYGEDRLKPLTMQHVADVLEVHVSTVSRAVQDKYIETPWGVYPLRFFFNSSMQCDTFGTKCSITQLSVKKQIRTLIEGEDKVKPLSDAAITELLNADGVEIKRRTVAKYRESMDIAKQSQRRC